MTLNNNKRIGIRTSQPTRTTPTQPVQMQVELSRSTVPCLPYQQVLYALMTLKCADAANVPDQNLNLCLVLDRSSSMRGAKLDQLKEAVSYIVKRLGSGDILTVVAFDNRAETIVRCERGTHVDDILECIKTLQPGGGTEIAQGLEMGINEMLAGSGDGRLNFLILLTDGHTYGDDARCNELAERAQKEKIGIAVYGLGYEWNEKLLGSIAQHGKGMLEFIDHPAKLGQVFNKQLDWLRRIIVTESQVHVRRQKNVLVRKIDQISPQIMRVDVKDTLQFGPLSRGEERSYILEIILPEQSDPKPMLVADLELSYESSIKPPRSTQIIGQSTFGARGSPVQARQRVIVTFDAEYKNEMNPVVVQAVERLTAYNLQEKAWDMAQQGNIASATQYLTMSAERLKHMGAHELAQQAQNEANQLALSGTVSASGRKHVQEGTRSLQMPARIQPE